MALVNVNYLKLQGSYLFAEQASRTNQFKKDHPDADVIRLGIGDVTQPLAPAVVAAMKHAMDEMSRKETFKGYGPGPGYPFLAEKIVENDFKARGVNLAMDEVFISDGSKNDVGNFQELFGIDNTVAIADPAYPVYVDSNVMAGRTGGVTETGQYGKIVYLPCTEENGMKPALPKSKVDIIYLCFPNNPTGMTLSKAELKVWVDYAKANKAIILFDAAYESYIQDESIPHSIFEVEGAREVAVEFRSFSKTAGFTGTRCAYTIIPKEVVAYDADGNAQQLNRLWLRRTTTKFGGTSYPVQVGAAAIYTEEGKRQVKETIGFYMENAKIIKAGLQKAGYRVFGGTNAPYIWMQTPNKMKSWDFFTKLLNEAHIVGTPGVGFGPSGEGYFRLSSFGTREDCLKAIERLAKL